MGKISPVSSKYVINASIEIEGAVDRPDVIGAIFGQTEGLLGTDLELRELQRSGRIGRIEVNTETRGGKTAGAIIVPSSLDKAETCIVGAALEIIQRIGPCNAKVKILSIEDVRVSKRNFVVERAKELLKTMIDTVMLDSQELTEEVSHSVRIMECVEYGRDRLPAGPAVDETEELILVEGRADVLNLLKNGFKNVIAMNGTSIPPTIIELSKKKEIVVFVDGDRGGNLIIKDLLQIAEIDFVAKAPDGKEVEELTKKEIHKSLRSRITAEQAKHELESVDTSNSIRKPLIAQPRPTQQQRPQSQPQMQQQSQQQTPSMNTVPQQQRQFTALPSKPAESGVRMNVEEKAKFGELLEDLIGTRGAYLLDTKLSVLGKIPSAELESTLATLRNGIYAVVFDGIAEPTLVSVAERAGVKHVVCMDTKVKQVDARVNLVTAAEL